MGNSLPGAGAIAKNRREALKPEKCAVLREGRLTEARIHPGENAGTLTLRVCIHAVPRTQAVPIPSEVQDSRCGWPSFLRWLRTTVCALPGGHDVRYAPCGGALRRLRFGHLVNVFGR